MLLNQYKWSCTFLTSADLQLTEIRIRPKPLLVWAGMTSQVLQFSMQCLRLPREVMSLHSWGYLKSSQHGPGQPGWPCLSRGVGPDDVQRFLPNSTVLWFFDGCLWIFCSVNAIWSLQTDLKRFHFLVLVTMEMLQRESLILVSHHCERKETSTPTIPIKSFLSYYSNWWCLPTSQNKCFSLPKAENPTSKYSVSMSFCCGAAPCVCKVFGLVS